MYKVMKRDGTIAEFDIAKISKAITKAFEAEKCEFHPTVIDLLALKVTSDFSPKIKDGIINVEDIQDSVERVLSQAGYTDVAKAYIPVSYTHLLIVSEAMAGGVSFCPTICNV